MTSDGDTVALLERALDQTAWLASMAAISPAVWSRARSSNAIVSASEVMALILSYGTR